MKRNHSNELKVIWALVIALLIGIVAHAQDYCIEYQLPTNSAPIKSVTLYAKGSTNWIGQEWAWSNTNKINFKSWNLPSIPCQLSMKSVGYDGTVSEFSQSIKFDTADFVITNPPVILPNPVLPPTFLLIRKL
jgi:hypothetical protein